jgi:hypothetical protein
MATAQKVCDATLVADAAGRVGYQDIIVSGENGAESVSVPIGSCSDDLHEVWHGMSTPAIGCGKHLQHMNDKISVFRGHRIRIAAS